MAEKKTIEVIVGKKEGTATKEGKAEKDAPKQEVSGRWHSAVVVCPYCGAFNRINESDVYNYWYTCWSCGNSFYA